MFIALTAARMAMSVAASDLFLAQRLLVGILALDVIVSLAAFQWLVFLRYRNWETGVETESIAVRIWKMRATLGWQIGAVLLLLIAVIGLVTRIS
ncbi:MAG: hypothetical protein AB7P34_21285 [Vicinamibacterales bacterium]